jgi:esterase
MPILNFQQSGTGSNLLLIHGLFGSLENLNMVAKGLTDNFCITNVDVRNHGCSFHEKDMNYSALAQDVIDTLDHLAIENTAVLGHSMGGKIAMQVALDFPERITKLIIADIAPITYPQHHTKIIDGLLSLDLTQLANRKEADKKLAPYVEEVGVRQFLLRNLTTKNGALSFKCHLQNIADCYEQIICGYQGTKQFDKPTLFIKGGNSNYIGAEHRSIISTLFPTSKAKIIQGAGHWLHAEKTTAFNKITKDFLIE